MAYPYLTTEKLINPRNISYDADTETLYFDTNFGDNWKYRSDHKRDSNNNYTLYLGSPVCYGYDPFMFRMDDCSPANNNPFRLSGTRFSIKVGAMAAKNMLQEISSWSESLESYRFVAVSTTKYPFFYRNQISTIVEEDVFYVNLRCIAVVSPALRTPIAFWQNP